MTTIIRAKFRCMSVTKTWDGRTETKLLPVNRSSTKDPENQLFWDATPGGECKLTFKGWETIFTQGDYYYIDLEAAEAGRWLFHTLTWYQHKAGQVEFSTSWDKEDALSVGTLAMYINYPKTIALFGEPGSRWDATFTHAEVSDNDPCTPC